MVYNKCKFIQRQRFGGRLGTFSGSGEYFRISLNLFPFLFPIFPEIFLVFRTLFLIFMMFPNNLTYFFPNIPNFLGVYSKLSSKYSEKFRTFFRTLRIWGMVSEYVPKIPKVVGKLFRSDHPWIPKILGVFSEYSEFFGIFWSCTLPDNTCKSYAKST